MNGSNMINFKAIRAQLMGLIVECPMDGNPEECPLYEKRYLALSDRVEWIKSLFDNEIFSIYSAHLDCLNAKSTALDSS